MKQSTQFVRLYLPSYTDPDEARKASIRKFVARTLLVLLSWLALYGLMELAVRLRGW